MPDRPSEDPPASTEHAVNLSGGLPETVLPLPDPAVANALELALDGRARDQVAAIVAAAPRLSDGWAALAELAGDAIERYAYFRVGYHRGLDALRANGWRGSGYVRWGRGGNDGFLRCLDGLQRAAAEIGEDDEAERCAVFLRQLDPRPLDQRQPGRDGS